MLSRELSHLFLPEGLFQIPEFLRKVYIYFLRIYETSGFIPESILLFLAVFAKLHNRWRFIDPFTFSDDRNEKFAYFIGSAENFVFFQVSIGSKRTMFWSASSFSSARQIRSALIFRFSYYRDDIRFYFQGWLLSLCFRKA